ncbi:MAG: hypothetical protein ACI9XO_005013 [Paraglaciecola sp.]
MDLYRIFLIFDREMGVEQVSIDASKIVNTFRFSSFPSKKFKKSLNKKYRRLKVSIVQGHLIIKMCELIKILIVLKLNLENKFLLKCKMTMFQ